MLYSSNYKTMLHLICSSLLLEDLQEHVDGLGLGLNKGRVKEITKGLDTMTYTVTFWLWIAYMPLGGRNYMQ